MPIYNYRCTECGAVSEVFLRKMNDPAPEICKICEGGPLERTVARTAFHLKGGGWYAQGYNSKGAKTGGAKDSGPKKTEGAKDSGPKKTGGAKDSGPKTTSK